MSEIIIRVAHIRKANLCMGGARLWFKSHNLNWNDFLSDGLPISQLEAMNDTFADQVCKLARKED